MKTLITLIVLSTTMLSVYAQGNYNTVTINYNGQNREIRINGRSFKPVANPNYDPAATSGVKTYNFSIVTNELAPGSHKLQIIRPNNRRTTETSFNLRNNYDLTINIAGNGSLQQTEVFRRLGAAVDTGTQAMSSARFNALYAEIRRSRYATQRFNMIQSAFTNTSNYFSTAQAKRLILLINGEPFRLQLAKAAVARISDRRNVYSLSSVLASRAGRSELAEYIQTTSTTGTGTTVGYKVAMSSDNFNALYNDVRNRYQPAARFNVTQNAFRNVNNFFTTAQAVQLIQLFSTEAERLQLLKDSYKTIVDPANFSQSYTLLNSQMSRDDLAYHVRINGGVTTTTPNTGSTSQVPMADATFNTLIESIRTGWGAGVRKREVLNAFSNTNNYFSAYQAAQLVQLETNERDRLDLAKASLRSIVDRQNIALLYNAFSLQSTRDELAAYINTYNAGAGSTTGTTTSLTPMSDENFSRLLEDTRRLWIPGAKRATILQAFATPNNYFTTAQALQLIQLDNDEPDRLVMAKASYKVLVDKQNSARLYELFTNQSYKNELAAYINSIQ